MNILKKIWNLAGNIYFTMGIFLFMVIDLIHGYFMLKYFGHLFEPINDMGFIKWAGTWGKESLLETIWLFILVGLLFLLSINAFACTTDRVIKLWKKRRNFKHLSRFIMRFGPHIMHYSMLIMFLGYLVSYLFSTTYLGKVLLPSKTIQVAGTSIKLKKLEIDYYKGDRLVNMKQRAMDVRAELLLKTKDNKQSFSVLSFNKPVLFNNLSIHLKDFSPHTGSGGMGMRKFIILIIKHDAGKGFYFTGMILFTFGLLIYAWEKLEEII